MHKKIKKMKKIFLITISCSLLFFQSCKDCELIELNDPQVFDCPELMLNIGDICDDDNPNTENDIVTDNCDCIGGIIFDCPELSLNIGDACDDGNPDTEYDVITNNCECIGEPTIQICEDQGNFFASRVSIQDQNPMWFFDEIAGPFPDPYMANPLEDMSAIIQENFALGKEGAYDQINERYAFAYYQAVQPNTFLTTFLHLVDTEPFNSVIHQIEEFYVAPVFSEGELYAISIDNSDFPNPIFNILQIDQSNGIATVIHSHTAENLTVFNNWLSATADNEGKLYFCGADRLLTYDINTNTSQLEAIIVDDESPEYAGFYGIEYQPDEDRLLAIRHKVDTNITQFDLVAISKNGAATSTSIFDIEFLGPDQTFPAFEYSTTFDPCKNIFYLSLPPAFGVPFPETTIFSIFDLENNTQTNVETDHFIYGLEFNEE